MQPTLRQPLNAIQIRDRLEIECYRLSGDIVFKKDPAPGLKRFIQRYTPAPLLVDWKWFDRQDKA